MKTPSNPRFPHTCVIYRNEPSDALADEAISVSGGGGEVGHIVYSGECRAYNEKSGSVQEKVSLSMRNLSLPRTLLEWTDSTMPMYGDVVVVTKGCIEERGIVEDSTPGNLGTHIRWRFARN